MSQNHKCTECGDESLRFCHLCAKHFCGGCACIHLPLLVEDLAGELKQLEEQEERSQDNEPNGVQRLPQSPSFERYEGYERSSGQSWLSNEVIVGSLPDPKLKAALQYHRSMARLCEDELRVRAATPRRYYSTDMQSEAYSVLDRRLVHPGMREVPRIRPKRTRRSAAAPMEAVAVAIAAFGKDFVLDFLNGRLKKEKE